MQVAENWSRVTGRVVSWTPPKGDDEPGELVVDVERVEPVKGHRNLLEKAAGTSLRIRVPPSAAATLAAAAGASIAIDVRRGREPGVVFANPEKIRLRS
jgi:hypothetical protein